MSKNHNLKIFTLFLCFLVQLPSAMAGDYQLQQLEIITPWSRATPNSAKVASGYVKIINHGDTADRLIAIHAALSDRIQIHSMQMIDGVMKMRHIPDGLVIDAQSEVELKPSGYHIMFTDINTSLNQGEEFTATLIFEKAGSVDVVFKVAAMGARSLPQE